MIYRDERTEQMKNKIYAELLKVIYYAVAISFVIKISLFEKMLGDCLLEYGILMGVPIYQAIRCRQLGVVFMVSEDKLKKGNLISITGFVIILVVAWFFRGEENLVWAVSFVLCYGAAFIAVRVLFAKAEKKRQLKLEKEYEDD